MISTIIHCLQLHHFALACCIKKHLYFRGPDFRPEYKCLGELRSLCDAQVLLCTATCDTSIYTDIVQCMSLGEEVDTVALLPDRLVFPLQDMKMKFQIYDLFKTSLGNISFPN